MKEIKFGLYTLRRKLGNGNVTNGFSFSAYDDEAAERMVYASIKDVTIDEEVMSNMTLVRLADYYPDSDRCLVETDLREVCKVSDLYDRLRAEEVGSEEMGANKDNE